MSDTTKRDCPNCWYRGPWTQTCIRIGCPKQGQKVTDGDGAGCPNWRPEPWPEDNDGC